MDEGFAIGRGISGLSSFASGWAKTKMFLDQQATAEDQWRKEFFFKQDEAMRRNMEADRRWNFEMEKWEAGEELRGINNKTAGLQLQGLTAQWEKSKRSAVQTPAALGDFSQNWNKIFVKGNPEQTKMNYIGYFTGLASRFPDANVGLIERLDKLFRSSGAMNRPKASKLVSVIRDGKKYTQVVSDQGNVINTIDTGEYSDSVVKILEGVEDKQKLRFDQTVKIFNTAISAKNSANKGLIMFSEGLEKKDDKKAWKGLLRMKGNLEKEIANSYTDFREEVSKQLGPFTSKKTREQLLDARLGPEYKMADARSIEFYSNEFEKVINESLEESEGTMSPEEVIAALEMRVSNNLEGDDLDAALDAIEQMQTLYTGEKWEDQDPISQIEESNITGDITTMDQAQRAFPAFSGGM